MRVRSLALRFRGNARHAGLRRAIAIRFASRSDTAYRMWCAAGIHGGEDVMRNEGASRWLPTAQVLLALR